MGSKQYVFGNLRRICFPFSVANLLAREISGNKIHLKLNPSFSSNKSAEPVAQSPHRQPCVVIMGSFNHGKTTILDKTEGTNFAKHEVHGTTQEIRLTVYTDSNDKFSFTMIDTPGQEFFHRMRLYGALVADLVILVVSAAEGPQKQTIESISFAKEMNIPVVVALNKIDLLPGYAEVLNSIDEDRRTKKKKVDETLQSIFESKIASTSSRLIKPLSVKRSSPIDKFWSSIMSLRSSIHGHVDVSASIVLVSGLTGYGINSLLDSVKTVLVNQVGIISPNDDNDDETTKMKMKTTSKLNKTMMTVAGSEGIVVDYIKSQKLGSQFRMIVRRGEIHNGNFFVISTGYGNIRNIQTMVNGKYVNVDHVCEGQPAFLTCHMCGDSLSEVLEQRFEIASTFDEAKRIATIRSLAETLVTYQVKDKADWVRPAGESYKASNNSARLANKRQIAKEKNEKGLAVRIRKLLNNMKDEVDEEVGGLVEHMRDECKARPMHLDDGEEDEEDDEGEEEEEEEVENEDEDDGMRLFVVKVDSATSLATIIDSINTSQVEAENNIKLIQADVGCVNPSDVDLAKTAQKSCPILAYNVPVDKHAHNMAKSFGVNIKSTSSMEELLSLLK